MEEKSRGRSPYLKHTLLAVDWGMSSCGPVFLPLRQSRVHEACGPSAMVFAAIAAGENTTLWIRESWQTESLHPAGFLPFMSPSSLLLADAKDQTDSLAVAEEALKDGVIPFVVIEITRPLDLREGRRLQLAAKAGQTIGLCIIPDGMGSNAAETRWHAAPAYDAEQSDSTLMCWRLIKNKSGTCGAWNVRWNATAHRLDVVSPAGE